MLRRHANLLATIVALTSIVALVGCAQQARADNRAASMTAIAEVRATAETVAARVETVSKLKDEEYEQLLDDLKRYVASLPSAEEAAAAPRRSYRFSIHAIKVADDDGLRAADITPAQAGQWVDKANETFALAGIQFDFHADASGPDWTEIHDTALNNMADDMAGVLYAATEAARYPDKIVVIFRHGPSRAPVQDAFSTRIRTNFIAMPGFSQATTVIGKDISGRWVYRQNIWMLAHELGHYLGLPHTFPGAYGGATVNQLETALFILGNGGKIDALDGDMLSDTPPDIGVGYYLNNGLDPCKGDDPVTVSQTFRGQKYTWEIASPRHNLMSYFTCDPVGITPMQIQVIYHTLDDRGVPQSDG